MADLVSTAANVRNATPVNQDRTMQLIAAVAITAGQFVYQNSSGEAALADASAAGTAVVLGVATETVGVGQAVPILMDGFSGGFTLSQAYGTLIFLSNTEGSAADAAGTVTAPIGRVMGLTDASRTKVLMLNCSYNLSVLPA